MYISIRCLCACGACALLPAEVRPGWLRASRCRWSGAWQGLGSRAVHDLVCSQNLLRALEMREGRREALGSESRRAVLQGRVPRVRLHLASDAGGPGSILPLPVAGDTFAGRERGLLRHIHY